ncbi:hypothetical protein Gogos_006565, partial [Gossypium gossypioides]|nr:hypothetical protein [Gossypium gossypioides]
CREAVESIDHIFRECPTTTESSRNKLVHEGKISTGKVILDCISRYLCELDEIEQNVHTRSNASVRWKTLIGTDMKINFDAAFDLNQARSGPGVVARNALGETLLLGQQLGLDLVVIEEDLGTTIKKCELDSPDKSIIGSIIRDIQHYKHRFRRISFNHIPRSENYLAHTLATQGLRKGEDLYLEGGLPEFV